MNGFALRLVLTRRQKGTIGTVCPTGAVSALEIQKLNMRVFQRPLFSFSSRDSPQDPRTSLLFLVLFSSYHIRSQVYFTVWRAYGVRMCVANAHVCGTRACVTLKRARLCVHNMIREHVKMHCNKKNSIFHIYYPPVIVCCSYVFLCNHCILYESVCYWYVLVCYSYESSTALIYFDLLCLRLR